MAEYLNLDGLQTLWTKVKNTFAPKSHDHNASDINAGTLPIARGGTGATTGKAAEYNILYPMTEATSKLEDNYQFVFSRIGTDADGSKGVLLFRKASLVWSYFRTKLGISSAVGSTTNPVYVDANGQLKTVGGTMLKQGSFLDTHSEGSSTMWIDGTNELFAFYDRGGTCTAYEYDLEWNSSSPAPAGTFSPADLSSHKTTASVANISANVFNSLTGYNQSTVYSGTKYAVYDLKLPASFAYSTAFYWSFGNGYWKPHYFEVLVWKNDATQYPNGYISKYRSTNVGPCGSVGVGVGATEGNSFTHIRIVMDKYSRLAAFGIVNYSSAGLATNYMSRTVDRSLYRNITVAKDNTYNLGSSSAKWANVFATNFNGALKGNADTASNCNYSGKADANTLVVKRTNAAGGAFIQYLPNNQTENWWRTGSVQDSSKFVFNYKGTDKAFIDTNGAYNGDVKGNASTASAAKSGSALETAINAKQDALAAQTAYSAKGSATKVPRITTNSLGQVTDITEVDIDQPDVSGKLNIDASNATSGTANGIFSHSPERPSSESYDVGDNDVLLVQDVGGDSTRRTTVSRLMKKFNGYLVDLGKRITEEVTSLNESIGTKISKTDIVQNLSAQNEGKVPSQKAVRYVTDLKLNLSGSNATAEGTTAILSTLTEVDDKADDYDYYIFGNDDDHTNMHKKPMSKLWDYIKDKIDAVGDILRIQPKDIGGSGVLNKSFIGGVRQIALDSSDTSNNISSIYSASTMSQYRSYYGVIVVINTGTSSRSVTGFYGGKTATVPANQCIYCARHRIGTTDAFFLGY